MRHWRPVVSEQSLVWPQEQKGQRSVQAKPSRLVAGALQECLQQCGTVMVLLPDTQHWENKALTCVGRARSPWPSAGFLPGPWKRRLCPAVQRETRLSKVILFPDVAEVTQTDPTPHLQGQRVVTGTAESIGSAAAAEGVLAPEDPLLCRASLQHHRQSPSSLHSGSRQRDGKSLKSGIQTL